MDRSIQLCIVICLISQPALGHLEWTLRLIPLARLFGVFLAGC
ncbi:MAG: hypothetical protein P8011_07205 [Acidihalobacter sp.]